MYPGAAISANRSDRLNMASSCFFIFPNILLVEFRAIRKANGFGREETLEEIQGVLARFPNCKLAFECRHGANGRLEYTSSWTRMSSVSEFYGSEVLRLLLPFNDTTQDWKLASNLENQERSMQRLIKKQSIDCKPRFARNAFAFPRQVSSRSAFSAWRHSIGRSTHTVNTARAVLSQLFKIRDARKSSCSNA